MSGEQQGWWIWQPCFSLWWCVIASLWKLIDFRNWVVWTVAHKDRNELWAVRLMNLAIKFDLLIRLICLFLSVCYMAMAKQKIIAYEKHGGCESDAYFFLWSLMIVRMLDLLWYIEWDPIQFNLVEPNISRTSHTSGMVATMVQQIGIVISHYQVWEDGGFYMRPRRRSTRCMGDKIVKIHHNAGLEICLSFLFLISYASLVHMS